MKEKYSVKEFEQLIEILTDDACEELEAYVHSNRLFVRGVLSDTDFMLRYGNDEIFTIARIEVTNKKIGVGTKLFEWCSEFASKNGYSIIEIEQARTEEMETFAKKHHFRKRSIYKFEANWIKELKPSI